MMATAVKLPSIEDLQKTNAKYNLCCTDEELKEYQDVLKDTVADYNFVNDLELPKYVPKYSGNRTYNFPDVCENKNNAWYVKCDIPTAETGKLAGKRVAIKDNTAVAGIPMMNGSTVLEGYMPEYDASVVKRILNEGGIIIGKTTCENLCFSGASFMTAKGPVTNPINPDHVAGGSSSGSGVAVALGEVDFAIGKCTFPTT